jgi:hypothetical protein
MKALNSPDTIGQRANNRVGLGSWKERMDTLELDRRGVAQLRDRAFVELRAAMPPADFAAALQCGARLHAALPNREQLTANVVMVAYGGGKDSSYALAFVRAVHLILFRLYGSTFRLRVVTNRHVGMPRAVLENIQRAYEVLQLVDDSDCDLLLVDANEVTPFAVDRPQSEQTIQRNRLDILMTGHRTCGDGRPTFCNACNLSMANAFGLADSLGHGVDVIITGDAPQEQRAYALWVRRLSRQVDSAPAGRHSGFKGFLTDLDRIAQSYFADIHGSRDAAAVVEQRVASDVPARLRFFSIYDDTEYAAGDHLQMLTGYLGFRFDDLAFSFSETDCGNPMLMAHLRGLKCERVHGRNYQDGAAEYVQFAVGLMRKKDFPAVLIDTVLARYESRAAVAATRQSANKFAREAYDVTEEQLVCMVYSPFTQKGAGLGRYLEREQPSLADRSGEIHALLAGQAVDGEHLTDHLQRISGLTLSQLRVLYSSSVRGGAGTNCGTDLIDTVLADDPHKAVIRTRHSVDGPVVLERISGR